MTFLLLIQILFCFIKRAKNDKLIFAYLHFRHGHRSPAKFYSESKDYLNISLVNPGELTGIGKKQEFLLGLRNRQRYIKGKYNFLSEDFNPHETFVYSTSYNRTIESAFSFLQGLYPMSIRKGNILTKSQEILSVPGVNISGQKIQWEINNLNYSALPHFLKLIPIKEINPLEKRIIHCDSPQCKEKCELIYKNNADTLDSLIKETENFNNKYSKKINKFNGNSDNNKYDFVWIFYFCDTLISDYTEKKDLEKFKATTGININDLLDECYYVMNLVYQYYYYGDKNKEIIKLEVSKILREMINFMKKRVDADIKGEIIDYQNSDYSRPKMVILSAHDFTVSAQEMALIKFFNLKQEIFKYPKYANQVTYELTRAEGKNSLDKKLSYNNYTISFYFNDDIFFKTQFDTFINVIEKNIFEDKIIDHFCEGNKLNYDYLVLTFLGALTFIIVFLIIFLAIILKKIKEKSSKNLGAKAELVGPVIDS